MLNLVLGLAGALIQPSEQVESHRSQDLQLHRDRLAKEGQELARMMFTSQAAPDGWKGIFDYLHQGVQESAQLREVIAQESFVRNAGLTDRLAEVETLLPCAPSRRAATTRCGTGSRRLSAWAGGLSGLPT